MPNPSCAPHAGMFVGVLNKDGVPLFVGPFGGVFAYVPQSEGERQYMSATALRELNLTNESAESLAEAYARKVKESECAAASQEKEV